MLGSKILPAILFTLLSAAGASAADVAESGDVAGLVERDQSCAYTCGSNCYQQKDIDQAVKTGYGLHQQSQTLASTPHQYKNFENFNFPSSAPWYEFPILASAKIYTGGAPGADRVIFDGKGKLDSLITHSGAKGNNFVSCVQGKQQNKQPDGSKSGAAIASGGGGLLAVAAGLTALVLV
ncbi:Ribonuclease/ribotoxin [Apiospora aurea]|uniref:ribonuclease T1 n=1 Tax=Apiospora aurea TaxID=335848 RepID=A0ABR1PUH9_9PEZI